MQPKHVKNSAPGRRCGEAHPRAVLTNHEVDLLFEFLLERDALIGRMQAEGCTQGDVDKALRQKGLSYRCLAEKFEVCKRYIGRIASGERRGLAPCP